MKIAGRTYSTSITRVMKNAMLFKYYCAFMKKRMADENTDFIFNYAVAKKKPLWLYWNCIHDTARKQINISYGARAKMDEAIMAPEAVDMKELNSGLSSAYSEIVLLLDQNFESAFVKSEYARSFAYDMIKTNEKKAATVLKIAKPASVKFLKTALIDYAIGDDKTGRKNLISAMVKDHPKGKRPSSGRLTKAEKALKKLL